MKRLLAAALIALLLTSCTFFPNSVSKSETLLKAPILSQRQKEIYDELNRTLDTQNIVYKYPRYGEQRSPFVFYDFNDDGLDEAVVFYSYKDDDNSLYSRILTQDEQGSWKYFFDIPSKGTAVDFIDFAPFLIKNQSCLIVGWIEDGRKNIAVYSMEENHMKEILFKAYHNYSLTDTDESGLSKMLLVEELDNNFSLVYYGNKNAELKELDRTVLYEETIKIAQMLIGNVEGYGKAVYVDEGVGGASVSYATEIIGIQKDRLEVLVGSNNGKASTSDVVSWEAFSQTFREDSLSVDLYSDGFIEVPREGSSNNGTTPDLSVGSSKSDQNIKDYMQYIDGSFTVKYTVATNSNSGYLVYFPQRWVEDVVIKEKPQRQEWSFYKADSAGELTTELLRIRVFEAGGYIDEVTKDDFLLGQKGLFSYYAYIPQTTNEPLAVNEQEVKEMFALIES